MTSKNYRRGYDAERDLLARLQGRGYWAERAHASKGTFDILAVCAFEALLIQVKRSKRRIVSLDAVRTAYAEDLRRVAAVPAPPGTRLLLALYIDRQSGEQHGTWRIFRVVSSGGEIVEGKIL